MAWRVQGAGRAAGADGAASGMRIELQPASASGHHLWDLAAALALLTEAGKAKAPSNAVVIGSLHQDGKTGLVTSTTPVAALASDEGRPLILPAANLREAGLVKDNAVVPVTDIGGRRPVAGRRPRDGVRATRTRPAGRTRHG